MSDAVTLLHRLIGGKVAADPAATTTLARQCARLPLALRVAAELAVTRRTTSLRELVAGFADQQRRLDLLDAGPDRQTAIRTVFSWSYQDLPADVARAFRLLALHPGADLDPHGAAALFGADREHARRLLDVLSRAHLLERCGPDRYGMHDLLRAYATRQSLAVDPDTERRAALTRLFDYFLAGARSADGAWLDAELANLVAMSRHTADHDWPAYTVRLAATLYRYLDGGHYTEALTIYTHAAQAARRSEDHGAQAHTLISLGSVYRLRGCYREASEHYRRALGLHLQSGDRRGEARALTNLGTVFLRLGQIERAVRCQRQALATCRQLGDQSGEARVLTNLGILDEQLGRYESARDHHRLAMTRYRAVHDRICEAVTLSRICLIDTRLGRRTEDHHGLALALLREAGHRRGQAHVLANLGEHDRLAGRLDSALRHYRQALGLFRDIGHRYGEAASLNGIGKALHAAGRLHDARTHHADALAIAVETSDREEQARAHQGLATIHHTTGDHDPAHRHWRHALIHYQALGSPEADTVRAALVNHNGDPTHPDLIIANGW